MERPREKRTLIMALSPNGGFDLQTVIRRLGSQFLLWTLSSRSLRQDPTVPMMAFTTLGLTCAVKIGQSGRHLTSARHCPVNSRATALAAPRARY
jgi:hypothetical protein